MKKQLCRNCGHEVEGLYCSNCGQKNNVERLKWTTLADNFLSTFVGDDAIGDRRRNIRYGFLFTIWATITRPGQTISEYLEGRQRKYFNPVTILLMLSGFYALIGVFFEFISETPDQSDNTIEQAFNPLLAYVQSHPAMTFLLLLPFTALAYKWVFRKHSDLRYIEYIYVGIFAAIFSISLLMVRLPFESERLAAYSKYATFVAFLAQCWFAVCVFKSLFKVSVRRAIWSQIKVLVISYTLCFLVIIALIVAALGIYYLIDPAAFIDLIKETDSNAMHDAAQGASDALRNAADSLKTK